MICIVVLRLRGPRSAARREAAEVWHRLGVRDPGSGVRGAGGKPRQPAAWICPVALAATGFSGSRTPDPESVPRSQCHNPLMFADATLSARIDRAEGRLVAQMAAE